MSEHEIERETTQEIVPAQPLAELVQQGIAITKVETEALMRVAMERPRDERKVLNDALQELELVADEAETAYYRIPYKEASPDGGVRTVWIEGPSIKAATALARRWGNCVSRTRYMGHDENYWIVEGLFVDFETMFQVQRPYLISRHHKIGKGKQGRIVRIGADQEAKAIQSGISKAARNAILQGLPSYLRGAYIKKAKAIAAGQWDVAADPKALAGALASFARLNVGKDILERHIGKPTTGWLGGDIAELRGVFNAIRDGETTVEQVFSDPRTVQEPQTTTEADAGGGEARGTGPGHRRDAQTYPQDHGGVQDQGGAPGGP